MHRVTIVGVGTNEVAKFDADKSEWLNPAKGKIKWDTNVDVTEAGIYNNCGTGNKPKAVIMTEAEYDALTSGKNLMIPASFALKLITLDEALETVKTILEDLKDNAKESAEEGIQS